MGFVADSVVAQFKGNYNLGIFLRVGTTPALHLSFSCNDIPVYIPTLDATNVVYQGGGRIIDLPQLEMMIKGISGKVTFGMSALDPVLVAAVMSSAPKVQGALVTVGICPMDWQWQPQGTIIPVWTGTAEFVAQEMKVETDPEKPRTQSLSLTASGGDSSRAFSYLQTFTDQAQRLVSATDNFCQNVSRYFQTYVVVWPRN